MLHLMSLCRFRVADLPLRPLLYAAGSAATAAAAGVCYFIKRDGEETAEPADTPLTEDPVQTVSSLDPGLMCDDATQTDSAVPENFQVTLAESEEKYEQAMKSNVHLNNEKSELMSQVNTLTNRVEQLEKALSWVRQSCNRALRDSASGQRLLTALKAKTELQKKVLKRRAERLVVSVIEADARYQDALESIGHLERRVRNQRFNMTLQRNVVRSLRDQVKVSNMRYEAARMELQGKTREFEGLDFKWRLLNDTVLKVGCELEEKERFWSELDEVMESIPTGERVVIGADFNGHVGEGNRGDEEVMGKFGVKERNLEGQMVVDFAKRMDMAVVNTYFQKREEHRVTYKSGGRSTQVDYILCRRGNLKEISDCKVVVGESVARQHRMVVCRMTLMVCKKKRSEIEKKTKWWKLKKEECCEEFRQKLRQALGGQVVLPDDWETTAEVIRETGRKVLGVSSGRRKEDKETWWWNEEVQDSIQRKRLAKKKWDMDRTEENRQEYKELQRRVKREVSKAKQKAYDELYTRLDTREGEKDLYRLARQESHAMLVRQYNMLKEEHDKLQQVTLADAAAAYEQANSRAELEKEKQQLEEMLFETDTRCGVLKQSCDQTSEAYRVLMSQYKERVKQHDELLKAYLAETTEKYGPAMESNAQLSHVNILQSSVQRLEKELSEARKKCEEITMELEREREDNSNLKAQYDDITETLKQCDELLNTHHTDFMFVEPVDL
ncbi:hypothetical protein QTP70_031207 [Hemibagrus guttatus]|uniref:Uncharacterized protein n=1 Tax=Hemibagrus guttatus TaxID=175788 RepID=A0AAE0PRJ9_9TELE|nr:hypothetical protein QTP70_031207 [Hemibagrus guttatus]